ncbi:alpha-xenorhabdolysin family binary toxin subunit A [Pseudomonas sp. 6D_7.1_Bac1]|uniref:alpha-xenorhabdolysin family binary toxin subunit A n=1 Tax=Pseudomonas sp. 6D_7.1_Bac1 TaxID=2971615 RepID=UPI0021CA8131|nr:alpha-xenorhabdolysin family binary toxin subunit A [Pseudomonas sp. 6D_7.1_Bac1]MCU1750259.1 alpha-xenorhabdolysin family binary toxin subunit A [Pseudomonas sp. 6D_7.1_Bac1]
MLVIFEESVMSNNAAPPNTNDLPRDVSLMISGGNEVARAPGVMTKEDIIEMKKYLRTVTLLPSGLLEVEAFLKYRTIGIPGLEPLDILNLFHKIKMHACDWYPIESGVIHQCYYLGDTAIDILRNGKQIIAQINNMPILQRVRSTVGNLSDIQLEGMKYTPDDFKVVQYIGDIIQTMKFDITMGQLSTQQLKDSIIDFKVNLSGGALSNGNPVLGLQSELDLKYTLMQRNNRLKYIAENNAAISAKIAQIAQLDKDYDYYVKMCFSAGLPFLWWISASIYGPKAETARKERNKLKAEVDALRLLVTNQENLQNAMESTLANLGGVGLRMLGAEATLNVLNTMWQTIIAKIDASAEQFANINDALRLTLFVAEFSKVIAPWQDVQAAGETLVNEYYLAMREYETNNPLSYY